MGAFSQFVLVAILTSGLLVSAKTDSTDGKPYFATYFNSTLYKRILYLYKSQMFYLYSSYYTDLLNPSLSQPFLVSESVYNKNSWSTPFNHISLNSIYKQEALIDARFSKLAIPFQDQINGLKVQVNRLEAGKSTNNKDTIHEINKRQVELTKPKTRSSVCEIGSSALCTFYYPDHPDVNIPNKTKFKEIPTSCKDLEQLGHKLNGLHLIKTTSPDRGTKIETVFCDFQSSKDVKGNTTFIYTVHLITFHVFLFVY